MSVTAELAPPDVELQDAQSDITRLQAKRDALQSQSRELSEKIAAIDVETSALKIRLAAGDRSVSAVIDDLDKERVDFTRRFDGLKVLIEQSDAAMIPLQARARSLSIAVDQIRQDGVVSARAEDLRRLGDEIIECHRAGCAALFNLMTIATAASDGGKLLALDEAHRHQLLACFERISQKLFIETAAPINERWQVCGNRFVHEFKIIAAMPPRPVAKTG